MVQQIFECREANCYFIFFRILTNYYIIIVNYCLIRSAPIHPVNNKLRRIVFKRTLFEYSSHSSKMFRRDVHVSTSSYNGVRRKLSSFLHVQNRLSHTTQCALGKFKYLNDEIIRRRGSKKFSGVNGKGDTVN